MIFSSLIFSLPSPLLTLTLWDKTSGTWINVFTILLGTAIGLIARDNLPDRMQRIITQGLGLLTLFLGVTMANSLLKVQAGHIDGVIVGLLAIVLGGLWGEWCQLETQLQKLGDRLKKLFKGGGRFTEGFVAASLLFCIGPLAIIGSLNNGLTGDNALLSIKSAMDGLASIAFSSSYGLGVGVSAIAILFYQGGLSLCAGLLAQVLPDPANAPQVLIASGVGGLMILGLGLNLLEVTTLSIAAFLPALALAPLFCTIAQHFG